MCSGTEPGSWIKDNKIKQNILNKERSGGYHTWPETWPFLSALRVYCHATINYFLMYKKINETKAPNNHLQGD